MERRKLQYKVHNPNTQEDTIKLIERMVFEANRARIENIIQESILHSDVNLIEEKDF